MLMIAALSNDACKAFISHASKVTYLSIINYELLIFCPIIDSVPISYLHVDAVSSDTLLITWTGADCVQTYGVFINGTNVNTTSGMSLLYDTGGNIGSIDVLVNSYDYFGRAVSNLTTQYQFNSECHKNLTM